MAEPVYEEPRVRLYHDDCVAVMAALPEASVDAIVCDPPYGLEFMGKEWDRLAVPAPGNLGGFADDNKPSFERVRRYVPAMQEWHERWALSARRVLKPGAHLIAFGGTRTFHRLTCALEDAGFEIRDCLMWLYGSGFPKSLDVSKAIDKAAGAERAPDDYTGPNHRNAVYGAGMGGGITLSKGLPATPDAVRWQGWGTALKPSWEPIILARKPLSEANVAANVLRHGVGGINVDRCRVGDAWTNPSAGLGAGHDAHNKPGRKYGDGLGGIVADAHHLGRWPANLVLDEEAARLLDEQSGELGLAGNVRAREAGTPRTDEGATWGGYTGGPSRVYADPGGASRFFYTSKADRGDRDGSKHPTVKPLDLCKWLVTLVTPPGGVVLDPFMGSGAIVYAARELGFTAWGCDREAEYVEDTKRRLRQGSLL